MATSKRSGVRRKSTTKAPGKKRAARAAAKRPVKKAGRAT